jgi:hypothetical protein
MQNRNYIEAETKQESECSLAALYTFFLLADVEQETEGKKTYLATNVAAPNNAMYKTENRLSRLWVDMSSNETMGI